MKPLLILLPLLLGMVPGIRSEIRLNAGDSYTHPFGSIPLNYCTLPSQPLAVNAHFWVVFDTNTFDAATDAVRIEAFETDTNEPPFYSEVMHSGSWGDIRIGSLWQDLQGVLRITMESGSATLESLYVGAVNPQSGGGYCAYNTPLMPVYGTPAMKIQHSASTVTVSWPSKFSNWVLEASVVLEVTNTWSAVTNIAVQDGTDLAITTSAHERGRFFRLTKP